MAAWEEASYVINSVINKTKNMLVQGGLIDENGNPTSSDPIYVGTYNGRGTQSFNCNSIKGHEKLSRKNFTIVNGISGGGHFGGQGNSDLAGGASVTITTVSYDDPILTVIGSGGEESQGHSATLTVPIYCIR